MLELSMTKKGWGSNNDNVRSRSKSRERVSLLGDTDRGSSFNSNNNKNNMKSRSVARSRSYPANPTRSSGKGHPGDEEKVSLLGGGTPGKQKRGDFYSKNRRSGRGYFGKNRWTMSRTMKYAAILVITALVTYKILRKENKMIHWEEYNNILEPKGAKATRCFEKSRNSVDEICSCPDPNKALENKDTTRWKSNHDHMVHNAKNAPANLDVVFFGDGLVEQLSGSRELGQEMVIEAEEYFDKIFKKANGGKFNAIALGSSGDTGPNLLWHWENGIKQQNLRPKLWFLMAGGNDLYIEKCGDRFVEANMLNLAKRIFEDDPDAKIVIHGIIPRKDDLDSKSNNLGHLWNRAQGVNLFVRKFVKTHSSRMHFMNLGQTLLSGGGMKGRGQVDPKLIEGIYPTTKGMEKFIDLAAKKLSPILKGFDREAHQKKEKPDSPYHAKKGVAGGKNRR